MVTGRGGGGGGGKLGHFVSAGVEPAEDFLEDLGVSVELPFPAVAGAGEVSSGGVEVEPPVRDFSISASCRKAST
jgi:hypothetical protein